jgi:hypothetical protein
MRTAAICASVFLVLAGGAAGSQGRPDTAAERAVVERTIRDSIGWAMTKDRPLLERIVAHDADLFMFNAMSGGSSSRCTSRSRRTKPPPEGEKLCYAYAQAPWR